MTNEERQQIRKERTVTVVASVLASLSIVVAAVLFMINSAVTAHASDKHSVELVTQKEFHNLVVQVTQLRGDFSKAIEVQAQIQKANNKAHSDQLESDQRQERHLEKQSETLEFIKDELIKLRVQND